MIHTQPTEVNSDPEAKDATATEPKIRKSLRPWTLPRSSGRYVSVSIVVAPMKPKFQPRPRRISAPQKLARSIPHNATAPQAARSAMPMVMMVSTP